MPVRLSGDSWNMPDALERGVRSASDRGEAEEEREDWRGAKLLERVTRSLFSDCLL